MIPSGTAKVGIMMSGYLKPLETTKLAIDNATTSPSVCAPTSYVSYCVATTPLARSSKIEFKSLKDVALVSLPIGSGTRRLVDGAAAAAGFTLRHAVTVGLPITVFNFVRRGTGAAIVPAHTLPR